MHTIAALRSARRTLRAGALALVLVLASCGGDDGGADGASGSEVSSDDGAAGEETTSSGDVDLGDFPIPAPAGGELIASGSVSNSRLLIYPVSEFEAITVFYEEWVNEVAPADPPPTIARDDAQRQFGATLLAPDIGLVQITTLESDGELRLALAVVTPE